MSSGGKTFRRPIVTKDQLAGITAQQIQTSPVAPSISEVPAAAPESAGKRGRPKQTEEMMTFNLRLPADVVARIDADRGALYSRNAWIAQAVADKLKRS